MKIKVHNSVSRINDCNFILNDDIYIYISCYVLYLSYRIDDRSFFLKFYSKDKEFRYGYGYGRKDKSRAGEDWLRIDSYNNLDD